MIRVHTPSGTHELEESPRLDGYVLRSPIGGTRLPSGLVSLRARYDLLGKITLLEARSYTWRANPSGGGSGASGAPVGEALLAEARDLAEQLIGAVLGAARDRHDLEPRRMRDIVVETTTHPAATLAALVSRSADVKAAAERRVTSDREFVVSVDADSPVDAAHVAAALASAGLGGQVHERAAYRVTAPVLPRDVDLNLTAAPA